MTVRSFRLMTYTTALGFLCTISGCGGDDTAESGTAGDDAQASTENPTPAKATPKFTPLDVNANSAGDGTAKPKLTGAERFEVVRKKIDPFVKTLIGKWNGTIQNKAGVEQVEWQYDVSTDEFTPGVKLKTSKSPYLKEGRLTYLPEEEKYQFTAVGADGEKLEFLGEFTEEPHDVLDANNTKEVQRAFKLELQRENEEPDHKLMKVVFNQKDNGRYLFELYDKRDRRYDTVNTMREGRTFGVSEDYGEKECIISQGLGTISIDYKGKTYWVCCSGCQAEFNADPEKWIAKYKALKAKEGEK